MRETAQPLEYWQEISIKKNQSILDRKCIHKQATSWKNTSIASPTASKSNFSYNQSCDSMSISGEHKTPIKSSMTSLIKYHNYLGISFVQDN